ncbi:MAG: hypothetical protein WC824_15130 [Bacteroidota bacterium]
MADLRKELVKLAHNVPELRKHLVPILSQKTATAINLTPATTPNLVLQWWLFDVAKAVAEKKGWGLASIGGGLSISGPFVDIWPGTEPPTDIKGVNGMIRISWKHSDRALTVSKSDQEVAKIPLIRVGTLKIPVLASFIVIKIP